MKKNICCIGLASLALAAVAGCQSTTSSSLSSGVSSTTGTGTSTAGNSVTVTSTATSTSKEDVAFTVWGGEEDQTLLSEIATNFETAHPEANFTITIGVQSESTAKDTILTDPSSAADVFAFASDQIYDLVKASCLQKISDVDSDIAADVEARNSAGSVDAAKVNDDLYAFPLTASNGYFLYYDSSILSASDVTSYDTMLAALKTKSEAAGDVTYKFAWPSGSGWYLAGWYDGVGLTATLDTTTSKTVCDWNSTTNNPTGLKTSEAFMKYSVGEYKDYWLSESDSDFASDVGRNDGTYRVVAGINGTWNATAVKTAYGTGYAATKLPTFGVNGTSYQQYSVGGFKFVGVNAYSSQTGWAVDFANYLSNQANQVLRYTERGEGPTNTAAAASIDFSNDVALSALIAQSSYAFTQLVSSNFWTPSGALSKALETGLNGEAALVTGMGTSSLVFNETDLQSYLDTAVAAIES
jgi:arabinogalactan oligomer / maltooligosaccharide transport system substrate-binding protein